jgi:hypothetical protein
LLRRHAPALIALAVYNLVFFFPVLFMGRVVSPNDVFYNYVPWSLDRPADLAHVQNSLFNDPPTAYLTLMSLLEDEPSAFHWNPYVACGIPGFGSSAAAVLSPLIALPVLALPLTWVWTALIFLKLNLAYLFAYLWLREERLGNRGAAIGAIVVAGAGIYAVRWLWQMTNATVFYPALLWLVRRAFNGKRNLIVVMVPIALAYALSGFPAAMAYGAYLTLAYAVFLAASVWRRPPSAAVGRELGAALISVAIAVMIAMPSLVPFVQFVRRSGYLAARVDASQQTYPRSHWLSFLDPDRLGNNAYRNWSGDPALGLLNNYFEATVFVGLLTIPLAIVGLARRRARTRWFWLAATIVVLACMFGGASFLGRLPGFKYSSLTRVGLLLPICAGYLAGAGAGALVKWLRRRARIAAVVAGVLAAAMAYELALFAGRFHPYLEPHQAEIPSSPTIDFLHREAKPFRIAPFFVFLWPNSSELFRLEDIRSHFGSEGDYRRLVQRIDPSSWTGRSTVLQLNSLHFAFDDPLVGLLGVRWLIEQNAIDIVRWKIFEKTAPGVPETGTLKMPFGALFERTVRVDAEPFWAIEVPATIEETRGIGAYLELTLLKNGAPVWSRRFTQRDTDVMQKLYIPLRPYARLGESVTVRVRSHNVKGYVLQAADSFYYGRVTTPIIFDRELADARLFRNLGEVPRFRAVSRLRKYNDDEFLRVRDIDFATEAVITDDPVMPPPLTATDARVTLTRYANDEQRVATESSAPFFLATSEKLTPELAVTIDGERVTPIEIDMLFAGLVVPAGKHEVVFERRIGRGWWWVAAAGVIAFLLPALFDTRRVLARRA